MCLCMYMNECVYVYQNVFRVFLFNELEWHPKDGALASHKSMTLFREHNKFLNEKNSVLKTYSSRLKSWFHGLPSFDFT